MSNRDESQIPERRPLTGDERDQFTERVFQTTRIEEVDQYIRTRGYERTHVDAERELLSEYSFDLSHLTIHYSDGESLAFAKWIGLDPNLVESGEITYEAVHAEVDFDEIVDVPSGETANVWPVVVGFLDDGRVGLSLSADGIEENSVDWAGLEQIASDVHEDNN